MSWVIITAIASLSQTLRSVFQKNIIEDVGVLVSAYNGLYEGTSKDTIGVAKGKKVGNTMRMVYDTTISIGDTDIRVSFDDRFVKADKKVVINRAEIFKWGIKIADVTIFFSK